MNRYIYTAYQPGYIAHHGIKGQKHGERRYQYKDGSLTPLGRKHYGVGAPRVKQVMQATGNALKTGAKVGGKALGATARVGGKAIVGGAKIAGKGLNAARRYILPTQDELDAEIARRQAKAEIKRLKSESRPKLPTVGKKAKAHVRKSSYGRLSDEELSERLARAQKEKQLMELEHGRTAADVAYGRQFSRGVGEGLKKGATAVAAGALTYYGLKLLRVNTSKG